MNHLMVFEKFLDTQYAPLYTAKRKEITLDIFQKDIILGNIMGGDSKKFDLKKGEYYTINKNGKSNIIGVSLTRNKNLRFNPINEAVSDIQFTFDTQKLKNNYRIIPYDYYGKNNNDMKKSESEELLVGDLKNASKYITNIEFNSDTINNFSTEAQKIDFFWSVGKYLGKHPHITVSSVSYFGRSNNKITKDYFYTWLDKIKVGDFKDIAA